MVMVRRVYEGDLGVHTSLVKGYTTKECCTLAKGKGYRMTHKDGREIGHGVHEKVFHIWNGDESHIFLCSDEGRKGHPYGV
jgi:hypothetical protein